MPEIVTAATTEDFAAAAELFREYAEWLNIDLSFQHFEEELLQIKEMYAHPYGAVILSKEGREYSGCVAVRKKDEGIAELKRMYIRPAFRRAGLGHLLLEKALSLAVELGYQKIRLDTLANMTPAIRLYEKAGFYSIEPYYFNPEKNALFFEKIL